MLLLCVLILCTPLRDARATEPWWPRAGHREKHGDLLKNCFSGNECQIAQKQEWKAHGEDRYSPKCP